MLSFRGQIYIRLTEPVWAANIFEVSNGSSNNYECTLGSGTVGSGSAIRPPQPTVNALSPAARRLTGVGS